MLIALPVFQVHFRRSGERELEEAQPLRRSNSSRRQCGQFCYWRHRRARLKRQLERSGH